MYGHLGKEIGQMGHNVIDTVGNFMPDQWPQCSTKSLLMHLGLVVTRKGKRFLLRERNKHPVMLCFLFKKVIAKEMLRNYGKSNGKENIWGGGGVTGTIFLRNHWSQSEVI